VYAVLRALGLTHCMEATKLEEVRRFWMEKKVLQAFAIYNDN
jgi:hypothetical protein